MASRTVTRRAGSPTVISSPARAVYARREEGAEGPQDSNVRSIVPTVIGELSADGSVCFCVARSTSG